jgi:hypothetical protein
MHTFQREYVFHARFEAFMVVKVEFVVFWVLVLCSVVVDTNVLEDCNAPISGAEVHGGTGTGCIVVNCSSQPMMSRH